MKKLECELKYQLTLEDYMKFKGYMDVNARFISTTIHKNYYLDTKELELNKKNITIKLREHEDGNYELIIKSNPKNVQDNFHVKTEFTVKITANDFKDIIENNNFVNFDKFNDNIKKELSEYLNIGRLYILGCLTTERTLYEINSKFPSINIDVNRYLGKEDFEVEWEAEDILNYKDIIMNIFSILGITNLENTYSKRKRFLDKLATNK